MKFFLKHSFALFVFFTDGHQFLSEEKKKRPAKLLSLYVSELTFLKALLCSSQFDHLTSKEHQSN